MRRPGNLRGIGKLGHWNLGSDLLVPGLNLRTGGASNFKIQPAATSPVTPPAPIYAAPTSVGYTLSKTPPVSTPSPSPVSTPTVSLSTPPVSLPTPVISIPPPSIPIPSPVISTPPSSPIPTPVISTPTSPVASIINNTIANNSGSGSSANSSASANDTSSVINSTSEPESGRRRRRHRSKTENKEETKIPVEASYNSVPTYDYRTPIPGYDYPLPGIDTYATVQAEYSSVPAIKADYTTEKAVTGVKSKPFWNNNTKLLLGVILVGIAFRKEIF